tara:strand:+ start:3715 stop:4134 length:420 start_codon:yes stop_codon:yes gene_type:complete
MSSIQNDLDPDVYIGLELPMRYGSAGFFKRTKTALEQTKSNIRNLISTQKGERLGNPNFGCDLRQVLFEQEGDVESQIEETIRAAIDEFLPFVKVSSIDISFSNRNNVNVRIIFSLTSDLSEEEQLSVDFGNYEPVDII